MQVQGGVESQFHPGWNGVPDGMEGVDRDADARVPRGEVPGFGRVHVDVIPAASAALVGLAGVAERPLVGELRVSGNQVGDTGEDHVRGGEGGLGQSGERVGGRDDLEAVAGRAAQPHHRRERLPRLVDLPGVRPSQDPLLPRNRHVVAESNHDERRGHERPAEVIEERRRHTVRGVGVDEPTDERLDRVRPARGRGRGRHLPPGDRYAIRIDRHDSLREEDGVALGLPGQVVLVEQRDRADIERKVARLVEVVDEVGVVRGTRFHARGPGPDRRTGDGKQAGGAQTPFRPYTVRSHSF
ncbi:MAG: hypothetical protein ACYTGG_07895 [Planctomycetota bacterium]